MSDRPSNSAISVDSCCDVSRIRSIKGIPKIRVWVKPQDIPDIYFRFDLPNGTRVGPTGRLKGWRIGSPTMIDDYIAKNLGADPNKHQDDIMFDGFQWDPDLSDRTHLPTSTPSPFQASHLPIPLAVSENSRWKFGTRIIEVIAANNQGIDSLLQVRVITNGGRKASSKKISVRSLLSKYSPVV